VTDYLILFLIVLGIHLTPAFTPPTWPLIALYSLSVMMPVPILVASAALAAALGRYALARATRLLRHRLGEKARRNLQAAYEIVARRRRSQMLLLGLFVLSPISSAVLFEAAGLAGIRLALPTIAYFANRLAIYAFYAVTARTVAEGSLGAALYDKATSPLGLAVQLVVLLMFASLVFVDWTRWLARRSSTQKNAADHETR
jgi:hypothetical protein